MQAARLTTLDDLTQTSYLVMALGEIGTSLRPSRKPSMVNAGAFDSHRTEEFGLASFHSLTTISIR